jgi:hypothetical protein
MINTPTEGYSPKLICEEPVKAREWPESAYAARTTLTVRPVDV